MMGWCVEGSFLIRGWAGVACPRLNGGGVGYGGWQCVGAVMHSSLCFGGSTGVKGGSSRGPQGHQSTWPACSSGFCALSPCMCRVHEPTCHACSMLTGRPPSWSVTRRSSAARCAWAGWGGLCEVSPCTGLLECLPSSATLELALLMWDRGATEELFRTLVSWLFIRRLVRRQGGRPGCRGPCALLPQRGAGSQCRGRRAPARAQIPRKCARTQPLQPHPPLSRTPPQPRPPTHS